MWGMLGIFIQLVSQLRCFDKFLCHKMHKLILMTVGKKIPSKTALGIRCCNLGFLRDCLSLIYEQVVSLEKNSRRCLFLLIDLHLPSDLAASEWVNSGKRYLVLKLLNCNNKNERKVVQLAVLFVVNGLIIRIIVDFLGMSGLN